MVCNCSVCPTVAVQDVVLGRVNPNPPIYDGYAVCVRDGTRVVFEGVLAEVNPAAGQL